MELYEEMLIKLLEDGQTFTKIKAGVTEVLEQKCYQALVTIKNILEDDNLEDKECFAKIEKIVCLFENLGSGCGTRHDFG